MPWPAQNPVGVGVADDEAISLDIDLAGLCCSGGPHRWQGQLPQGPRRAQILWLAQNLVGVGIADDEAISLDIDLAGLCCSSGPHRWQRQLPQGPRRARIPWPAQNPVGVGLPTMRPAATTSICLPATMEPPAWTLTQYDPHHPVQDTHLADRRQPLASCAKPHSRCCNFPGEHRSCTKPSAYPPLPCVK